MNPFQLLIGGRLVPGDSTMPVVNPATGDVLAQCPRASERQVDDAVKAAKVAWAAWARTPIAERRATLVKLADRLDANAPELAKLLTQEQGKPLAEATAEVAYSAAFIRFFATMDLPSKVLEEGNGRRVEQHRRPLGVVAAIIPWNFPLLIICFKLPPATLAGNTIVVKPSGTTPLTTLRFGEICAEVFPPGVVNIIADANDLGGYLSKHPDVNKVTFTGSSATGRKVMASASETIKRITLELGGNDASIVLDDVDPAKVAPAIFGAAFMNCGQVCLAIKRVYVHESIYDKMCDELAKLADGAVVGDGLEAGTTIGPMQNKAQFDKVSALIEETRKKGRIIAGGTPMNKPGYFIRPTIVRDVTDGDRVVDEEQFGPILPIIKVKDDEDAIRRANSTRLGLGGSVWSSNPKRAHDLASRMESGTVWINKHLDFGPNIPFGGAKESGIGVEFAEEGLAEFTQLQVINIAQ